MSNYLYKSISCFVFLFLFYDAAAAETVLHNVNGYTQSNDGIRQFSVLVFDDAGRVVATGGDELLAGRSGEGQIDGGGLTVLPGLIDAHAHVYGLGLLKTRLDITGIPSVDEAVSRIQFYADEHPHARWILGRGWNQVLWPVKEFPTAAHAVSTDMQAGPTAPR